MKITCQSCQSKYTIADEKIQGKVAKIRCRKCGATVLVDGSASGASNGPGASAGDSWLANVADGDQRTLQLSELVEAFAQGIVTGDTYIWKDGMPDWLPLSQVPEVMGAVSNPGGGAVPYDAPAPAPVAAAPVAARRDAARGRGATDLFGAGREEEVATSAAPPARLPAPEPRMATPGLSSGARDEQSVLFSLSALTGAAARSGGSSGGSSSFSSSSGSSSMGSTSGNSEDSGLIDLNALAKAQATVAREGAVAAPAPTPFMFPAALGTIEPAAIALAEPKKPKTMLFVAIGGVVAAAAVAAAIFATRKPEVVETASSAAIAASAAPVASAPVAAPEPEASAAPATSAAKTATATPKKGPARPAGGAKPAAAAGPAAAAPALPPPPKKTGGCGCAPGDLQCQIRCSATGH